MRPLECPGGTTLRQGSAAAARRQATELRTHACALPAATPPAHRHSNSPASSPAAGGGGTSSGSRCSWSSAEAVCTTCRGEACLRQTLHTAEPNTQEHEQASPSTLLQPPHRSPPPRLTQGAVEAVAVGRDGADAQPQRAQQRQQLTLLDHPV